MQVLLSLLDANLTLHQHAARALEKAGERQQSLLWQKYLVDRQTFLQAYIALREAEARQLRLLRETALLAQSLQREEAARQIEKKLEKTFRAQEEGNGKKAVILSKEALKKYEKTITKDRRLLHRNVEQIVETFRAQHAALARAATLFKALDPSLLLLHSRADAAILKTYAHAGDSAQFLRELALEEVERARPLALAAALEAHRSKMRQHMTRLSNARRHFTAFIHQPIPALGAL